MKIVFFGSPDYAVPFLKALVNRKLEVVVVTKKDKPVGRHHSILFPTPVKKFASHRGLAVLTPDKLDGQFITDLKKRVGGDELLGVITAYVKLIPEEVIALFKYGILNVHFSLLPKYAGLSPVQAAILNGEKITGVSILKINREYDKGELISQVTHPLDESDNAFSLIKKLSDVGVLLMLETIDIWKNYVDNPKAVFDYQREALKILNFKYYLPPVELDREKVEKNYTRKLTRETGYVAGEDLEKALGGDGGAALKIERMFRAYYGWPGIWTLDSKKRRLKILALHREGSRLILDRTIAV